MKNIKTINLRNVKQFFTKDNSAHRYSDRLLVDGDKQFIAISTDYPSGIEWSLYKIKDKKLWSFLDGNLGRKLYNMFAYEGSDTYWDNLDYCFTGGSTIKELKEELEFHTRIEDTGGE
mgnify:FL=1